jgi:hypothetical protein
MKKSVFLGVFVAGVVLFGSCGGNKQQQYVEEEDDNSASVEDKEVRDRTIYGICTAETGMNTLQMITDSGDTLKLNISRANEMGKVFGGLQPSDRLAVVPDSSGRMALQVINLNTLMGDWVMPDPIDGSAEVGIRIKEGGIAESIDQSVIVYRTWKIINGDLEIQLVREGGGDEQEDNRYELLILGPDTLAYRTLGRARDETETFEYNRWKEKPKVDLHGLELEDTGDEFNKI